MMNKVPDQVSMPATTGMLETSLYGRPLSERERRVLDAATASRRAAMERKARADRDAAAWRLNNIREAGNRGRTRMMNGLNPLVVASAMASPGLGRISMAKRAVLGAASWGGVRAAVAKAGGAGWGEAGREFVKGAAEGAAMEALPGGNLTGAKRVAANAVKLGAMDAAVSVAEGKTPAEALKDGASSAAMSVAFDSAVAGYRALPAGVRTGIKFTASQAALVAAAGKLIDSDRRADPGTWEHFVRWSSSNPDGSFDDYAKTLTRRDVESYLRNHPRPYVPDGVDPDGDEAFYRYAIHGGVTGLADPGVRQDSFGGDVRSAEKMEGSRFANSRNFLATDRVPDTIFGIPVAKAEGEWTREDLAFFRKHPEAGGYYSMGDEGPEEDTIRETSAESRGALGAGIPLGFAAIIGPNGIRRLIESGEKTVPELQRGGEIFGGSEVGEIKDVRHRKGWRDMLDRKHKTTGDLLDFSSPQGKRLLKAYPGLDRILVTTDPKENTSKIRGSYLPEGWYDGEPEQVWINPDKYKSMDDKELYEVLLHEGVNHAIYNREESFPQLPNGRQPGDLTNLGYALSIEENAVETASKRGAQRAFSKKGKADTADFIRSLEPNMVQRIDNVSDDDLSVTQKVLFKQDLKPIEAAVEVPLLTETPVPVISEQEKKK